MNVPTIRAVACLGMFAAIRCASARGESLVRAIEAWFKEYGSAL